MSDRSPVDAFSDLGFRAASTRDIATRSGVSQGLITYHFTSKDEPWKAAADRIFTELRTEILDGLGVDAGDPHAAAREAIRVYVRLVARRPELIPFMVEAGRHESDRMKRLVVTHLRPMYQAFEVLAALAALAGVDPMSPARVEAHADLMARLLVPD
jgi:TetR/AcrR family transcriptional regulator